MKILAVSGGIDSMVMLHLFHDERDIIVAHFDHGIRPSSKDDAEFVQRIAKHYGLRCVVKREELGKNCSESLARERRYAFLKDLAKKHDAKIYTAHHQDDLIETIAINLHRGTGWRGLAPFQDADIERPLLDWSKAKIYRYATENKIIFRQDQSNTDERYLRNRLRLRLAQFPVEKRKKITELYVTQYQLSKEIYHIGQEIIQNITDGDVFEREIFRQADDLTATELLRQLLERRGHFLTYPQLTLALDAVRTYHKGKKFNLPQDRFIEFSRKHCKI